MLALARFTLKGPYQAAAVVGLLAVLAVLMPKMAPVSGAGIVIGLICMLLSSALVGLIILTQGSGNGLKAIAVSIAGITLVAWIVVKRPDIGLWTALIQWLPIILLSQTLRSTKSLSMTVLAGVGLGTFGIAMQYLFWPDLEREWISLAMQRMDEAGQVSEEVAQANIMFMRQMIAAIVASAFLIFTVIVLISRWLQARLAESGGFANEFRNLALGKPAATVAVVVLLITLWTQQAWMMSLTLLMIMAFMLQGIAVVHSRLASHRQGGMLLGLFYFLLIFPISGQIVVPLTGLTGVIDNWLVFRKNAAKPRDDNDV